MNDVFKIVVSAVVGAAVATFFSSSVEKGYAPSFVGYTVAIAKCPAWKPVVKAGGCQIPTDTPFTDIAGGKAGSMRDQLRDTFYKHNGDYQSNSDNSEYKYIEEAIEKANGQICIYYDPGRTETTSPTFEATATCSLF